MDNKGKWNFRQAVGLSGCRLAVRRLAAWLFRMTQEAYQTGFLIHFQQLAGKLAGWLNMLMLPHLGRLPPIVPTNRRPIGRE
eukprot:8140772-Heterocapsa_arctica.AAC.1